MQIIRKLLLLFVLMLNIFIVAAQQFPITNWYINNKAIYNPANVGDRGYLAGFAGHRQQWVGIEGAPTSTYVNVHSPIQKNVSLGGLLWVDETSLIRRTSLNLSYRYRLKLSFYHTISFGLSTGASQTSIDFANANVQDNSDAILNQDRVGGFSFNTDIGINYTWRTLELGIAIPNLINTNPQLKINDNTSSGFDLKRNFLFIGQYKRSISNDIFLKSSVLLETYSNLGSQIEINSLLNWQHIFWAGLGYRQSAGLILYAGFLVLDQIELNYAYEFLGNSLVAQSGNTHEIQIGIHLFNKKMNSGNYTAPRF